MTAAHADNLESASLQGVDNLTWPETRKAAHAAAGVRVLIGSRIGDDSSSLSE